MIYGQGIRLPAPEREDIPRFVAWLNDPEVRQGLPLHLPLSQADEEHWFDEMLKRPPYEHPLTIEIQEGDNWRAIGNCGYHNLDWRCRSVELGIFIGDKSCWNRGYGTQVMRLMLQHGFDTLNMNRIYLEVYETNPRAIRSYEKAGFIHEGRKRQGMYKAGCYFTSCRCPSCGRNGKCRTRWPAYDAVGQWDEDAANSPDGLVATVTVQP